MNTILLGDNLELMREMPSESVDLVATDPPFNTGKDWGEFDDRWDDGLKGYLKFMDARIREIHRLLKPTGSFYLHCDPTASHYLKVLCDTIFGIKQFRNEIVWHHYNKLISSKSSWTNKTDSILFYSKTNNYHFSSQYEKYLEPIQRPRLIKVNGKPQRAYDDKGKPITFFVDKRKFNNVWAIPFLNGGKESVGYPTQKPIALYQRIIKASSNEGDIVLDPFCGSGTTLVAAKHLFRKYIGIDQNPNAIEIAERRLNPPQQDIPF